MAPPSAQISTLLALEDIMFIRLSRMALKLKIMIRYINIMVSPSILTFFSPASSPRMRFRSASLIPAHLLSLVSFPELPFPELPPIFC